MVKQEMARVNIDILISELKWMGMVLEARFDAVKSNVAEEPGMSGP